MKFLDKKLNRDLAINVHAIIFFIICYSLINLFTGCFGTEVENQNPNLIEGRTGQVFNSRNSPAANARVLVIKPDFNHGSDLKDSISVLTDLNGVYKLDSSISGNYNVIASKENEASRVESFTVNSNTKHLPTLTLGKTLTFKGRITINPGDKFQNFYFELIGTGFNAFLDLNGNFEIRNLPPDNYKIRIFSKQYANYDTVFTERIVGDSVFIKNYDLVFRTFTVNQVPVKDLRSALDSSAASIKLSWGYFDRRFYRSFSSYQVKLISTNQQDSAKVYSTQEHEKLISICKDKTESSCIASGKWMFTVQVLDTNKSLSPVVESLMVDVPAYNSLRPYLKLELLDIAKISINTSIHFKAKWKEFSEPITQLQFINISTGKIIQNIDPIKDSVEIDFTETIPQKIEYALVSFTGSAKLVHV